MGQASGEGIPPEGKLRFLHRGHPAGLVELALLERVGGGSEALGGVRLGRGGGAPHRLGQGALATAAGRLGAGAL